MEWNKAWQIIHKKNFPKSLDYQTATYKQKDKKSMTLREFLVELNKNKYEIKLLEKAKKQQQLAATHKTSKEENATSSSSLLHNNDNDVLTKNISPSPTTNENYHLQNKGFNCSSSSSSSDFDQPHLSFSIEYPHILKDIINLIHVYLKDSSHYSKNSEFEIFLNEFLHDFFMVEFNVNLSNDDDVIEIDDIHINYKHFKILYGNDVFFMFIRLVILLYTRFTHIIHLGENNLHKEIPSKIKSKLNLSGSQFESVDQIYHYFFNDLFTSVIYGKLDQIKYEEECKQLFGVSCYILFSAIHNFKFIMEQVCFSFCIF